MTLVYRNANEVEVIVENSNFLHNTAPFGGGLFIELDKGSGSIEFSNCAIYNNTAQYGGGVEIELHNKSGSLEFNNCTIYNNTAHHHVGGVLVYIKLAKKVVVLSLVTALYIIIMLLNMVEEWELICIMEVVVLSSVTALYTTILDTMDQDCTLLVYNLLQQVAFVLQMFHLNSINYQRSLISTLNINLQCY